MIETARNYVGSPFRHGGRIPETGIDCAGLIACVLTDLGVAFDDVRAYGLGQDNMAQYERCLESCATKTDDLSTADIVLFRYTDERGRLVPCHAAITDGVSLIHSPWGGMVCEEPFSEVWRGRVWSGWNVRPSVLPPAFPAAAEA